MRLNLLKCENKQVVCNKGCKQLEAAVLYNKLYYFGFNYENTEIIRLIILFQLIIRINY